MNLHLGELRQNPRIGVSWPVTVESGERVFQGQAVNLSRAGLKVHRGEPLEVGNLAQLRLHSPDGRLLDLDSIVWRVDEDGPVFFFLGVHGDETE
jgi:hypothetical protein